MLTRFIRAQLAIFAIASVVGVSVMVVNYLQAPMLLGIGRIEVTLELPAGGGIYRFANVTYRGVQVGKVTEVDVTSDNAVVSMSLQSDPRIPSDLDAEIRSLSAVGEQYVDLRPRNDSAPYLYDGSVIPASRTSIPQPVGPMLDRLSVFGWRRCRLAPTECSPGSRPLGLSRAAPQNSEMARDLIGRGPEA